MAWRVIETAQETWHVQPAAEMRPDGRVWQLTIAFRAAKPDRPPKVLWAPYPLESSSKASLFQAADRLSDDALRELLARHLV
jgi:hypothetical protein